MTIFSNFHLDALKVKLKLKVLGFKTVIIQTRLWPRLMFVLA